MIYNNAELSLDVNSRTKQMISTGIQFSTQDVNTARIIFTVTKDGERLPLSSVVGKLVMIMADGSRFVRNVDIVDKVEGVAQYVLSEDEIKHYGNVQAELNLYYTNEQSLSVHKFSFVIDQALIDSNITPVAEYYIDDFESLKSAIQEIVGEMNQTIAELEEKFENLENIETKTDAQAKADKALADAKTYTDDHANRTDNPHEVTKEQVGLSNVVDVEQATKTEFTEHVEDNVRHVTSEERDKWNGTSDVARFEALGQLSLILKGSLYLKNDYNFFGYLSNGDHSNLATMEQNDIAKFGDAKAVTWLAGKDYVSVRSPKMYLVEKSDEGGNAVTPARTVYHSGNLTNHAIFTAAETQALTKNTKNKLTLLNNISSSFPAGSATAGTGAYKIPRSGAYFFQFTVRPTALTNANSVIRLGISRVRNGTTTEMDMQDIVASNAFQTGFYTGTFIYQFNQDDEITPWINPLNEDITIQAGTRYNIYYLGDTPTS
ncbi:BppU family phage baseplate upper protein [Bacillus glycinifermentans]|uniref:BppU family phage baseplate upper protein n=1 Tax=Bacillus glycinifermentans TaxID=1664069 RepID=UPI001FF51C26|nr:BppU family phage baseplate upper protein [Bacillus glycinifermentans]UOY86789.1 BppU family phage baseplate upper protein [Bacillus glycinifermentans]